MNSNKFPNLKIIDHPLVQHKLAHMRDFRCNKDQFRAYAREISLLMTYEISRDLPCVTRDIQTPVDMATCQVLRDDMPVIVPILRAGLGMAEGLEQLLPGAPIGHIGLYRDEESKKPVEYLVKLPDLKDRKTFIVDPMLATGHTSVKAIDILIENGAKLENLSLMVLVAAPEGVNEVSRHYPDMGIITASLDDKLNDQAFIVPGLGDAGDRLFGTK